MTSLGSQRAEPFFYFKKEVVRCFTRGCGGSGWSLAHAGWSLSSNGVSLPSTGSRLGFTGSILSDTGLVL